MNRGKPDEYTQRSTIDLAFGSDSLNGRILSCKVQEDLGTGLDHYPIQTTLVANSALTRLVKLGRA